MKRSFLRKLAATLALGCLGGTVSAQMYTQPPMYGGYNPYAYRAPMYPGYGYGYARPVMPAGYYSPMMQPPMMAPMMSPMMPPMTMMQSQPVMAAPTLIMPVDTAPSATTIVPQESAPRTLPPAQPLMHGDRTTVMSTDVQASPLPSAPTIVGGERHVEVYVPQPPPQVYMPYTPSPAACTSCGSGCCIVEPTCAKKKSDWHVEVGGEAYVLQPFFQTNPAFTVTTTPTPGLPPSSSTTTDLGWSYSVSPGIWIEVVSPSGLGVRGSYFYFDESSQTADFTVPAGVTAGTVLVSSPVAFALAPTAAAIAGLGPDTIAATSHLHVETGDLECTYSFRPCNWVLTLSGGGRYLYTEQDYNISVVNTAGDTFSTATFAHNFTGGGPLVGFEASHRVFAGLSLYGKVDGALLVGSASERSLSTTTVAGVLVSQTGTTANRTSLMPVADIELGLDYTFDFGKIKPFVRAAVVDKTYFDAGNATSHDGNLSLFGGQLTAGIAF